jgi:hypothetical protein
MSCEPCSRLLRDLAARASDCSIDSKPGVAYAIVPERVSFRAWEEHVRAEFRRAGRKEEKSRTFSFSQVRDFEPVFCVT